MEKTEINKIATTILKIITYCTVCLICCPYILETWGEYLNKEINIRWWQSLLFGTSRKIRTNLIFGSILTWIIMLYL